MGILEGTTPDLSFLHQVVPPTKAECAKWPVRVLQPGAVSLMSDTLESLSSGNETLPGLLELLITDMMTSGEHFLGTFCPGVADPGQILEPTVFFWAVWNFLLWEAVSVSRCYSLWNTEWVLWDCSAGPSLTHDQPLKSRFRWRWKGMIQTQPHSPWLTVTSPSHLYNDRYPVGVTDNPTRADTLIFT